MGLQSVELVMAVEEEFGVEFTEAEAAKLETVGGMHMAILQKLRMRGDEMPETVIFEKLREIIVEQLGVRTEKVESTAYFVRDLGC